MALNPPKETDKPLKNAYVFLFALLFVIGMAANVWERSVESNKQENLQKNATEAEKRFSQDLKDVKESSHAILAFVANPPKGMTADQVSSVVKTILNGERGKNESAKSEPSAAINFLAARVDDVTSKLRNFPGEWKELDNNLELELWEDKTHLPHTEAYAAAERDVQEKIRDLSQDRGRQIVLIFYEAEQLRNVLVALLPKNKKTPEDENQELILGQLRSKAPLITQPWQCPVKEMSALADYLDTLIKRVSTT